MTSISSPGLNARLALVVENFGQGQHAFGLGADIDDHMGAGKFQHRALDDAVFADGFFGFGRERFERGGEVFGG